jgi:hypothetical protein
MHIMEPVSGREARASSVAVRASLGAAVAFESLTLPETQAAPVEAASPWRQDPYHTVVLLAQFAVAMLALALVLRFLVRRSPGGRDRERQMVRAAVLTTATVGMAVAFEWAAVIAGAPVSRWGTSVSVQVGGLAVVTASAAVAARVLVRCRGRLGAHGRWRDDWLGDMALLARGVPVLRRWAGPRTTAWIRRRAMTVFVVLSALAGAAVTGAQAVGEHVTDPVFLLWLLIAETAANLAFCVIGNAVAGFVARPPLPRTRRVAEVSVVAGCVATLLAIAFHDPLWSAIGSGTLSSSALEVGTLGAGLGTSLVTAALLLAVAPGGPRPARDGAASG